MLTLTWHLDRTTHVRFPEHAGDLWRGDGTDLVSVRDWAPWLALAAVVGFERAGAHNA